jgi:hypothetical protein
MLLAVLHILEGSIAFPTDLGPTRAVYIAATFIPFDALPTSFALSDL